MTTTEDVSRGDGCAAYLTSHRNPRARRALALLRRGERERTGLMRAEGHDLVRLALERGAPLLALLYCPALFRAPSEADLLPRMAAAGAELTETSEALFRKLAERTTVDGWLAVVRTPRRSMSGLRLVRRAVVLVAEGIEKPGNLGALVRSADAVGADAVLSASPAVDLGHPNVLHASRGALFTVPVAEAGSAEAIGWLRTQGVRIIAATPDGDAAYDRADLSGAVAFAVGRESRGLSAAWRDAAELRVRIPMRGAVDSLNVAVAGALLLYEAARQRAGG